MVISCSPWTFKAVGSLEEAMVSAGGSHKRRPLLYSLGEASEETGDEGDAAYEGYSRQADQKKKRRLTADQVKALEKNFEVENKLEPDRKVHLARELGLQPRQVAVWFQNRRARWKTKQLEKDYDSLKEDYDALKREYEVTVKEKEKLQAQALCLSEKLRPCPDGGKPWRGAAASTSETRENHSAKASIALTLNPLSNEAATESDLNSVDRLLIPKASTEKEGRSTSSDAGDDTSEVLDVESPLIIPLEHFPICSDLSTVIVSCPDHPPSLTNTGNGNYEKLIPPHVIKYSQRSIVKLEDHESYSEENSNYFLNLEDQVTGIPWWEWS